jgi:hypothetical protein
MKINWDKIEEILMCAMFNGMVFYGFGTRVAIGILGVIFVSLYVTNNFVFNHRINISVNPNRTSNEP